MRASHVGNRSGRGSGVIFERSCGLGSQPWPSSLCRTEAAYSSPSTPVVRMVARCQRKKPNSSQPPHHTSSWQKAPRPAPPRPRRTFRRPALLGARANDGSAPPESGQVATKSARRPRPRSEHSAGFRLKAKAEDVSERTRPPGADWQVSYSAGFGRVGAKPSSRVKMFMNSWPVIVSFF